MLGSAGEPPAPADWDAAPPAPLPALFPILVQWELPRMRSRRCPPQVEQWGSGSSDMIESDVKRGVQTLQHTYGEDYSGAALSQSAVGFTQSHTTEKGDFMQI